MDLEQILLRDRELLTVEDIERVAGHFRSKIHTEKAKLEEETKKPLTNVAFNRFGGGEKAMTMDVPLFGAVNAQYKKADNKDHPRIIALDKEYARLAGFGYRMLVIIPILTSRMK
ncbi:MAG: SbcC/MukB-like Walker B domain-containing protein [Roseburia hominis]